MALALADAGGTGALSALALRQDRQRERMAGAGLQRRGERQHLALGPAEGDDIGDLRLALGQRAGLVEAPPR